MLKWRHKFGVCLIIPITFSIFFMLILFVWFNFGRDDSFQSDLYQKWSAESKRISSSDGSDPIQIVMASSGKRMIGMMATINSIVSNTNHSLFFYLITIPSDVDHLRRWIVGSKLNGIKYEVGTYRSTAVVNHSSRSNDLDLAKLYIPTVFPTIRGTIVFLEDDCIVRGNIEDLTKSKVLHSDHYGIFSSDCESTAKRLGFISNKYSSYVNTRNTKIGNRGIDPRKCTFSSGVFVVNITDWIERNVTQQLDYWIRLGLREDVFVRHEAKSAMMIVFYRKVTNMEPSWHVRHLGVAIGSRYSNRFLSKAKLLHWDGPFKPWGRKVSHVAFWDPYYVLDPTGKYGIARRTKMKI